MLEVVGVTDRGIAKPMNEDRMAIDGMVLTAGLHTASWDPPFGVAVFDGVSAGGRGADAATIAAATFADACEGPLAQGLSDDETIEALNRTFEDAHQSIVDYGRKRALGSYPATTVGGLYFSISGSAIMFSAGDTRVYRCRNGMVVQMSSDHTYVQNLVDMGASNEAIEWAAPESHAIIRALGMKGSPSRIVEVPNPPGVFLKDDLYLVCSDGITDGISTEQLESLLVQDVPLVITAKTLVNMATHQGSLDNLSVVLVKVCFDNANGEE